MKTINRGWLKRQVQAGKMLAKCNYSYTDDYRFDVSNNFGETDWIPARLSSGYSDFIQGQMNFTEYDFQGHGRAWQQDGENIVLYRGNTSYELQPR